MKRLILAGLLVLATAGLAWAGYSCSTHTYFVPGGPLTVCTTCCNVSQFGTNCTTVCN